MAFGHLLGMIPHPRILPQAVVGFCFSLAAFFWGFTPGHRSTGTCYQNTTQSHCTHTVHKTRTIRHYEKTNPPSPQRIPCILYLTVWVSVRGSGVGRRR